jgi:hypothetical protein
MQAQAPPIENGQPAPEYETLRSEIEQPLLVRLLNSINVLMSHFVQKMTKDWTTIIGADSRRATCFQGFDAE